MKIQYLGTAAAEGWPALFCDCSSCNTARERGGKNIRTRSQAIIDDRLLIDFCPDTYYHVLKYGLKLWELEHCIVTHGHTDHFYPTDLMMKALPYAKNGKKRIFSIHGPVEVKKLYEKMVKEEDDSQNISECVKVNAVLPLKPFSVLDYEITPLLAKHDPNQCCYIYLIQDRNGTTILYGNDSAYFPEETWNVLSKCKLDLVSLDCTMGVLGNGTTHLGYDGDVETKQRLEQMGCVHKNTKFVLNHFSHNCGHGITHEEMEEMAAQDGFLVSYDGYSLEI